MGLTPNRFTRLAALSHVWNVLHDDIVVATSGLTSRESAAVSHRSTYLYVLNAMVSGAAHREAAGPGAGAKEDT